MCNNLLPSYSTSQLMVVTLTLETGQNVLLNVEEELKQDPEPVQTLHPHMGELTARETALKLENVILKNVLSQVCATARVHLVSPSARFLFLKYECKYRTWAEINFV